MQQVNGFLGNPFIKDGEKDGEFLKCTDAGSG